jgi:hypothetical protein
MNPPEKAMDGHIFTTLGWLPADQVELRETVTHDDEQIRIVRVDKYVGGEWVGNDLVGHIKKGHEFAAVQSQL